MEIAFLGAGTRLKLVVNQWLAAPTTVAVVLG